MVFVLILIFSPVLLLLIVSFWLMLFFPVLSVLGMWKMFLCRRFDSMSDFLVSYPLVCFLLPGFCLYLSIRCFISFEKSFCSWLDSHPF